MSEKKNLSHNRKKDFLSKEIEHIDITSFDARKIISSMEKMSFVSIRPFLNCNHGNQNQPALQISKGSMHCFRLWIRHTHPSSIQWKTIF